MGEFSPPFQNPGSAPDNSVFHATGLMKSGARQEHQLNNPANVS